MLMKAIQIMVEEELLARLDGDEEVRRDGRSAVIRRAVAEYLRRTRARRITDAYRKAYGRRDQLDEELSGWPDEGKWPES